MFGNGPRLAFIAVGESRPDFQLKHQSLAGTAKPGKHPLWKKNFLGTGREVINYSMPR